MSCNLVPVMFVSKLDSSGLRLVTGSCPCLSSTAGFLPPLHGGLSYTGSINIQEPFNLSKLRFQARPGLLLCICVIQFIVLQRPDASHDADSSLVGCRHRIILKSFSVALDSLSDGSSNDSTNRSA